MVGGQLLGQLGVEGLGEAAVGDGGLEALLAQDLGGAQRDLDAVAVAEQGHAVARQQQLALADLDLLRRVGHRRALGGAAGIAEGDRAVVVVEGGAEHVHQHRLVARGHHDDVGEGAEVGDVEGAVVGGAVVADEAGAVHGEDDVQLLQADVVDDLVEGALEEGRVDRADRLRALDREARGEQDRVLLGDADVVVLLGQLLVELVEPGPSRHRRGDPDHARVALGLLDQGVGEDRPCTGAAPWAAASPASRSAPGSPTP